MTSFQPFAVRLVSSRPSARSAPQFRKTQSTWGFLESDLGPIGYESSLERDFLCMMLVDPQVRFIEHQPLRIDFVTEGRTRLRHYTPDYRIERDLTQLWIWGFPRNGFGQAEVVEVKPRSRLRIGDRAALERYSAGRAWASQQGEHFRIITEEFISEVSVANAVAVLASKQRSMPTWLVRRPVLAAPMQLGDIARACLLSPIDAHAVQLLYIGISRSWFWAALDLEISLTTLVYPLAGAGQARGQGRLDGDQV